MQYNLEIEKVKEVVKPGERVLIQLPSGLRSHWQLIADTVRELGATPLLWAGSCYGACDLPQYKVDVLLHFGHEEFTTVS